MELTQLKDKNSIIGQNKAGVIHAVVKEAFN